MKAMACCHEHPHQKPGRRWPRVTVRGVVFAAIAALMPKCPLCIAAYLGAIGLSGLAARVDPRALWLAGAAAMALVAAPVAAIVAKSVLGPARQLRGRGLAGSEMGQGVGRWNSRLSRATERTMSDGSKGS
jgi:hypothetical protein